MKDLIIPVNNEAHSRALVSVVGEDTAQVILRAYKAIDSAMVFGYERGLKYAVDAADIDPEPKLNAQEEGADWPEGSQVKPMNAVQLLEHEAFKNGYDAGYEAGYNNAHAERDENEQRKSSYDDGYVDGVSDARMCPAEADARVAELCGYDDFETMEDFEDFYDDQDDLDGFDGLYEDFCTSEEVEQPKKSQADHELDELEWYHRKQAYNAAQEYSADGERLY